MSAAQPALPGLTALPPVGDPLGRRYTPDGLALRLVERLAEDLTPDVVIEAHVGGGGVVRAARTVWPNARVIGVDIDPDAPGLALCDEAHVGSWEDLAATIVRRYPAAVLPGNPPFDDPLGGDPDRAQRQVRATAKAAWDANAHLEVGWILPLAYRGTQAWAELLAEIPIEDMWPIVGRPWGAHVRETAVYRWQLPGRAEPTHRPIDGWRTP